MIQCVNMSGYSFYYEKLFVSGKGSGFAIVMADSVVTMQDSSCTCNFILSSLKVALKPAVLKRQM